jgi:DNA-binding response OmpR family regulator
MSSSRDTAAELDLDQFTKIEASLLRYFQSHQNETISTEQLLADVWKRPDATNRRVQEAIRRLRLHLEAAHPPIGAIENDRGRGYRFTPAGQ